jgi:purine-binding chemotaxis protein CheW
MATALTSPNDTLAAAKAAAALPDGPCSLLRMAVGHEVLAVPIEHVREILQVGRLTPLPRTPAFVRGVMNLRGAVVPVIDLAARLGHPATELGRRSCIVVVERAQDGSLDDEDDEASRGTLVVGLLVDAVFEVFDRNESEIEPPPALGTRIAPEFLRGITRAAGALVGVLALQEVLAARELSAAIASFQPH